MKWYNASGMAGFWRYGRAEEKLFIFKKTPEYRLIFYYYFCFVKFKFENIFDLRCKIAVRCPLGVGGLCRGWNWVRRGMLMNN